MAGKLNKQLLICADEETRKKLQEYAREDCRSISSLLRKIVHDWLGKKEEGKVIRVPVETPEERQRLAVMLDCPIEIKLRDYLPVGVSPKEIAEFKKKMLEQVSRR